MDEKGFISLEKEEYDKLMRDSFVHNQLVNALMKNAKMYHYGSVAELTFSDVDDIIRYILPVRYSIRLEELLKSEVQNKEDKE